MISLIYGRSLHHYHHDIIFLNAGQYDFCIFFLRANSIRQLPLKWQITIVMFYISTVLNRLMIINNGIPFRLKVVCIKWFQRMNCYRIHLSCRHKIAIPK